MWQADTTMATPKASDVLGHVTLVTGPEELLNERAITAALQAVRHADEESEVSETTADQLTMGALADALYAEIRLGLAKVDRIRRNADVQVASHRTLLTLLEDGDVAGAARELEQHLAHAEDSMLTALHLPADG